MGSLFFFKKAFKLFVKTVECCLISAFGKLEIFLKYDLTEIICLFAVPDHKINHSVIFHGIEPEIKFSACAASAEYILSFKIINSGDIEFF